MCSVRNILREFTKFTGKHVAGLISPTLLKKRFQEVPEIQSVFSLNFAKFLNVLYRTTQANRLCNGKLQS